MSINGTLDAALKEILHGFPQLRCRLARPKTAVGKRELFLELATPTPVASEIASVLSRDNPRLLELKKRYRALQHPAKASSLWTDGYVEGDLNLRNFRADNAYLWQSRGEKGEGLFSCEMKYLLTLFYTRTVDRLGLLDKLREDTLFGIFAYAFNGKLLFTRDLLDSILEITFLEEQTNLSQKSGLNILDIGAGYGRLAYRMVNAFPQIGTVFCTDAVAESTFLSEFYLRFRKADSKARAVPLDEAEQVLAGSRIDIATNVHSFSECPLSAICWWLDLLVRCGTRYLMIVPNDGNFLRSREPDGPKHDFLPEIEKRGFKLKCKRPKYQDPLLQQFGIHPAYYYFFERA